MGCRLIGLTAGVSQISPHVIWGCEALPLVCGGLSTGLATPAGKISIVRPELTTTQGTSGQSRAQAAVVIGGNTKTSLPAPSRLVAPSSPMFASEKILNSGMPRARPRAPHIRTVRSYPIDGGSFLRREGDRMGAPTRSQPPESDVHSESQF